jgi:hypothetical protein
MKMSIPLTEEYRALREVIEEATKNHGGQFTLKVSEGGDIHLSAGDKTAFVGADDPMNEVFRREWWGIKQQ